MSTTTEPAAVLSLTADVSPREANWRRSLRTLARHRMAVVGSIIIFLIVLYVLIGSFLIPESRSLAVDTSRRLQPPTTEYPMGTDAVGRDIFARTIYGGQISIFIGVTAVLVQMVVGVGAGLAAGYLGGMVDSVLMRIAEAMLSIPQLFLALLAVHVFSDKLPDIKIGGREFSNTLFVLILVLGLTSWMRVSRVIRSVVLATKEQEFITAAKSIGASGMRVALRHILPNCTAPIIVSATLGVANAILLEAYLGFLGLGVRQPMATWGNIMNDAYFYLSDWKNWYFWFFPATLITLTILGINFLGDGIRDALDPRSLK